MKYKHKQQYNYTIQLIIVTMQLSDPMEFFILWLEPQSGNNLPLYKSDTSE